MLTFLGVVFVLGVLLGLGLVGAVALNANVQAHLRERDEALARAVNGWQRGAQDAPAAPAAAPAVFRSARSGNARQRRKARRAAA